MVLILGLIGFFLAQAVWREYGPVWGILTGMLFIGGLGWKIIFGILLAPFALIGAALEARRTRRGYR